MTIYLDFDGTVVHHAYPKIGKYNEGCLEVLNKLQLAGHNIVLNTRRVEFKDESLMEALVYLAGLKLHQPIGEFSKTKIDPGFWKRMKEEHILFIDDECIGIPVITNPFRVDWHEIDKQLTKEQIIKP